MYQGRQSVEISPNLVTLDSLHLWHYFFQKMFFTKLTMRRPSSSGPAAGHWTGTQILSLYVVSVSSWKIWNEGLLSNALSTRLFSRLRWTTGSAQQSNNYGNMPCMCYVQFWVLHKHNSFLIGPIQPSSPTTKRAPCSSLFIPQSRQPIIDLVS